MTGLTKAVLIASVVVATMALSIHASAQCPSTCIDTSHTEATKTAVQNLQGESQRGWMVPELLAAAKKEGSFTLYGSMNEEEALPLIKTFENASGIKVDFVRSSDTGIIARIQIEARAQNQSWDMLQNSSVSKLPETYFAEFDPPEAKKIIPEARGENKRWYGIYANYTSPGYNTKLVSSVNLPKNYEEFLGRKEWKGRIAIEATDGEWLKAIYEHYGEARAEKLVSELIKELGVVPTNGRLALARSTSAGEYSVMLSNYTNLILNVKLSGGDVDFWVLDPVVVFFGQVGVNAKAPHPNAAKLFANYLLSAEGQSSLTKGGRIPTRLDVETNPPGVLKAFAGHKLNVATTTAEDDSKWRKRIKDTFSNAH